MSAERLREAARVLSIHVDALTTDMTRWDDAFPASQVYADKSTYERMIVHPRIVLSLAAWLNDAADWESVPRTVNHDLRAHEIADLILGAVTLP